MPVDMRWTYGLGSQVANVTDGSILDANLLNANVCIDMFLDSNSDLAGITNGSAYEVRQSRDSRNTGQLTSSRSWYGSADTALPPNPLGWPTEP